MNEINLFVNEHASFEHNGNKASKIQTLKNSTINTFYLSMSCVFLLFWLLNSWDHQDFIQAAPLLNTCRETSSDTVTLRRFFNVFPLIFYTSILTWLSGLSRWFVQACLSKCAFKCFHFTVVCDGKNFAENPKTDICVDSRDMGQGEW